jgi:hypothetical protein
MSKHTTHTHEPRRQRADFAALHGITTRWVDNDIYGHPDTVTVGLGVARIGSSSVRYELAIFRNEENEACAQGHFVQVYVDRVAAIGMAAVSRNPAGGTTCAVSARNNAGHVQNQLSTRPYRSIKRA